MAELILSDGAKVEHKKAWRENERMLANGGILEDVKDWGAKRMGNILRIAALLHVACNPKDPDKSAIERETFLKAKAIGDYLIPHAKVAYGLASQNMEMQLAKRILEWIKANQLEKFSLNDCHKRFKSNVATAQQLSKILGILVERNYIREPRSTVRSVGRPSRIFEVNPKILVRE